jgi:uncharacterized membrane protein YfcA
LVDFFSSKTPYEFWLTCIIIAFGVFVLLLLMWGLRGMPNRRPEDFSRALIVITVITAALILITAGYSDRQAAPAFGLFGTIIGYTLGRMAQARSNSEPSADTREPAQREGSGPAREEARNKEAEKPA